MNLVYGGTDGDKEIYLNLDHMVQAHNSPDGATLTVHMPNDHVFVLSGKDATRVELAIGKILAETKEAAAVACDGESGTFRLAHDGEMHPQRNRVAALDREAILQLFDEYDFQCEAGDLTACADFRELVDLAVVDGPASESDARDRTYLTVTTFRGPEEPPQEQRSDRIELDADASVVVAGFTQPPDGPERQAFCMVVSRGDAGGLVIDGPHQADA